MWVSETEREKNREEIVKLFKEGKTNKEIAKIVGYTREHVGLMPRQMGCRRKRRLTKNNVPAMVPKPNEAYAAMKQKRAMLARRNLRIGQRIEAIIDGETIRVRLLDKYRYFALVDIGHGIRRGVLWMDVIA